MTKPMKPFVPVTPLPPPREEVEALARVSGQSVEDVMRTVGETLSVPMFQNNRYTVQKRMIPETPWGPMWHLSVRRNDRKAIHDWRDLQRVKTELCGAECEGVELYPAESRVMDTANQYHIYVLVEPGKIFPIGYHAQRVVTDEVTGKTKQRPLS